MTQPRGTAPSTRRAAGGRVLAGLAVAILSVLGAVASAPAAGAHGADGTLGVEAVPSGPNAVRVRTLLRYASDGHTVSGAAVTATAEGAGGTSIGPVTLADTGDGTYAGELTGVTPGVWTVVVRSASPAAEARSEVTVAAPTKETTSPSTSPSSDRGSSSTAPDRRNPDSGRAAPDSADGDPLVGLAKYLVVVLGVAIVTATLWVGLRRRR